MQRIDVVNVGRQTARCRLSALDAAFGLGAIRKNPTGMVAGTVWPTFYSSILPGRTGRFRGTANLNRARTIMRTSISRSTGCRFGTNCESGSTESHIDAPPPFSLETNRSPNWWTGAHAPWNDVTVSQPADLRRRSERSTAAIPSVSVTSWPSNGR
jgi:hypothetical protein